MKRGTHGCSATAAGELATAALFRSAIGTCRRPTFSLELTRDAWLFNEARKSRAGAHAGADGAALDLSFFFTMSKPMMMSGLGWA